MIKDKYTALALSRQRKYQLRHRDAGLCIKCNNKAVTGGCCLVHAIQNRELMRGRVGSVKRIQGKTYRLTAKSRNKAVIALNKTLDKQ